jgi:hypothetical protein
MLAGSSGSTARTKRGGLSRTRSVRPALEQVDRKLGTSIRLLRTRRQVKTLVYKQISQSSARRSQDRRNRRTDIRCSGMYRCRGFRCGTSNPDRDRQLRLGAGQQSAPGDLHQYPPGRRHDELLTAVHQPAVRVVPHRTNRPEIHRNHGPLLRRRAFSGERPQHPGDLGPSPYRHHAKGARAGARANIRSCRISGGFLRHILAESVPALSSA